MAFDKIDITFKEKLILESKDQLDKCEIAYETYGKINKNKSNVILVCHALTGDQFCSGIHPSTNKKGWWDILVGPGKVIDTNFFLLFVVMLLVAVKEVQDRQVSILKMANNIIWTFLS